ncbi:MAG: PAS domain S-box protein, partial [Candidatus Omnitrophica bacterium]|nr:PAS domain S-box protein [Candidatus Omnitrophota bacterium]
MEEELKKQLIELEQKYRSLMDGIKEAILIIDPPGRIIEINNMAQQLLGYSKEELLKMNLDHLYPPKESPRVMAFFNEVLQRKSGLLDDALLLTKNGKAISAAITSSVVEWAGRKIMLGFITDITERKQAETLLSRFAYFSELNPNPIVELDMLGRICYINPAAKRVFPDLQTVGLNHPFLAGLQPIITAFQRGEKNLLIRDMQIGNIYYQESIYCTSDRQFIHVYGVDITERKIAEIELLQSEKLAALGKFSAGVAHEVRNPLGIILGGVEFLEKKLVKA